jgi:hypothetical protein
VALLACSVWAEMVSISQIVTSSAAGPSKATIVLSAILFVAILLLVIMLPVAFFRVKVQDAREQAQFHQVLHCSPLAPACIDARQLLHTCRWKKTLRETWHCNKKCRRPDHVCSLTRMDRR